MTSNKFIKKILSIVLALAMVVSINANGNVIFGADEDLVTSFSYDFAYNTPGYAEGTIRLSATEDGVYKIFWGDENGDKLTKNNHEYSYVARLVVKDGQGSINIATGHTAIPYGAKKVLVYRKNNLEYTYNLPTDKLFEETDGYSFGSLSDPHYGRYSTFAEDDSVPAVNAAMDFLHSEGIKFVGVCGDLTAGGEQTSFDKYNAAAHKYDDMTVLTCTGNHDTRTTVSTSDKNKLDTSAEKFYNSIFKNYYTVNEQGEVDNKLNVPILANDALTNPVEVQYRAQAGGETLTKNLPGLDFVTEAGGNIYIFLNEIAKTGETYDTDKLITTGQMDWLKEQLETYSDKNVFIYFHSFLCVNTDNNDAVDYNNCVGDLKNKGGYSYDLDFKDVVKTTDGLNMQALLSKYNNVTMFTGHSHWQYAAQEHNSILNIGQLKKGDGATLAHVASVGAPRYIGENDPNRTELNGYSSEGTIVTTYEDCTVYTSVEFLKQEYESYATYIVPSANSDKYKPVKNAGYQKSTTAITGTEYLELEDLTDLQVAESSYNLTLGAAYQYTSKGTENKDGAMTDGKISGDSYASKAGKSTTQSVYITLDGEQDVSNINKFLIHFSSGVSNADTLSIELSQDGTNYESAGYYTNHKYTDTSLTPDFDNLTITKFKYVKLNLISGGKTYGYHIKEFAVIGNERNLIPNTANSASSLVDGIVDEEDLLATDSNLVFGADYTQSSIGGEDKAGALTDGSMTGFMNTERKSSAKDQTVVIDLGIGKSLDVSNIDFFLLYCQNEATFVTAFDVAISLDGTTYESVGSYTNVAFDDNHFDADLSGVTLEKFRYVKVHFSDGHANYGYQVKEFGVIGFEPVVTEKPADQTANIKSATSNYALNKTVYVSSTATQEGKDPTVLTDGKTDKYWSSLWDKSRTFEDVVIDLGQEVDADTIGSFIVNFKSNNTFCKNVEFYVSDSYDEENPDEGFELVGKLKAATWDVLMKSTDDSGNTVCNIPQYTGIGNVRYVKIHMNGHGDYGFQVREVAVIKCAKKQPESDVTTEGGETEESTTAETTTKQETTTQEVTTTKEETTTAEVTTTKAETTTAEPTTTAETTTKQETTTQEVTTTKEVTTVQPTTTTAEVTTTKKETTTAEETTTKKETTTVIILPDKPEGVVVDKKGVITWAECANAVGYNVYVNDKLVGTTSTPSFEADYYLKEAGNYSIKVTAVAMDGREGTAAIISYQVEEKTTVAPTTTEEQRRAVPTTTAKTYNIVKGKITKAKSTKKKTVKLTWEKQIDASGYQIKYSMKKSMKKAKKVLVKTNKTTTTIKKLKRKKTYFFKIRGYYMVDGIKKWGTWSKAKKAKVK